MDLSPMQIAIASNALASGVLAFAFIYLWRQHREARATLFWGLAYLFYCARQTLFIVYAPSVPLVADVFFVAVPLLILAGTLTFLGRPVPYRALTAIAGALMLGAAGGFYGVYPRLTWLSVMLGAASLTLFVTSAMLLRHREAADRAT